jgi:hypothetical protein
MEVGVTIEAVEGDNAWMYELHNHDALDDICFNSLSYFMYVVIFGIHTPIFSAF